MMAARPAYPRPLRKAAGAGGQGTGRPLPRQVVRLPGPADVWLRCKVVEAEVPEKLGLQP